jgi:hypothetical protein
MRLGQVDLARQRGNAQSIVLTVSHPGWGAPASANLRFVETWTRDDDRWDLARYAYDLLLVPGQGGSASIGTTASITRTASIPGTPIGTTISAATRSTCSLRPNASAQS